jgi:uncharacterized protein (TIGR02646 family)
LTRIRVRANTKNFPAIEKADELWRDEKVTDKLHESHYGKCCYCERKRDRKREMDVEHYRPKGDVESDGSHKGYWWLAFTWNNLLWSCKTCNQKYKLAQFSLFPNGTRAYQENDDLTLERPHLINPKVEDPSHFISFHVDRCGGRVFVRAVPRSGIMPDKMVRANETITILGLNREENGNDLVKERGDNFLASDFESIVIGILSAEDAKDKVPAHRQFYIDTVNSLREKLKKHIQSARVFSGVYRDYLRRHNIEYESLLE